jgi:hypothetical protein
MQMIYVRLLISSEKRLVYFIYEGILNTYEGGIAHAFSWVPKTQISIRPKKVPKRVASVNRPWTLSQPCSSLPSQRMLEKIL